MKTKTYELTDRELKVIIDYIRSEARLSYQLKRRLWLSQENLKLRKGSLNLAQGFRQKKYNLKRNVNKEIYKYIVDGDEIDTRFLHMKLKKNELRED